MPFTYVCNNCNVTFTKRYRSANEAKPYCSRSCAATVNNSSVPKRTKAVKSCRECDSPVDGRSYFCKEHKLDKEYYMSLSIGEYRDRQSVKGKHPSWTHAHIRSFARSWHKELQNMPCEVCGYSIHVEIAHIKPVSSFDDSALLSEVNARENVRVLCPNHHWEFDNLR